MFILSVIVFALLVGACAAQLAQYRGRDPVTWFLLAAAFGLLAVLVLYLLPPVRPETTPSVSRQRTPQPTDEELVLPSFAQEPQTKQEWFYIDTSGRQEGPCFFEDLKLAIRREALCPQNYVWTEGMVDWKRLEELPELVGLFAK